LSTYDLLLAALLIVTFIAASLAASAETALTSISRIKLRRLVEEGNQRAAVIEKLHREPNDYLTAILTTNTLAIVVSATCADLIADNHGMGAFFPQLLVKLCRRRAGAGLRRDHGQVAGAVEHGLCPAGGAGGERDHRVPASSAAADERLRAAGVA